MTERLIVADENIPGVEERFSTIGNVVLLPGREISNQDVLNADVLLVRSVTQVDQQLLRNSRVGYVASSTIGTNHLDIDYLCANNIAWANAPGSNANSVAEYILSCIASTDGLTEQLVSQKSKAGIVGFGNVGKAVVSKLTAIGIECLIHDPLIDQSIDSRLTSLEEVLSCQLICMHTPLTKTGCNPTHHLINEQTLTLLKANSVLINAGRGEVIDNQLLKEHLRTHQDQRCILDVWENEPTIDSELLPLLLLSTPHIAGYSLDGKQKGLEMIFQSCCSHYGIDPPSSAHETMPTKQTLDITADHHIDAINESIKTAYNVKNDEQGFTELIDNHDIGTAFDLYRKHYPTRREFKNYRIKVNNSWSELTLKTLAALDFELAYE